MKTSARNQFTGTVSAVRLGSINDEVELKVNAGVFIVATVTTESRSKLGLQVGAKAFALVKAFDTRKYSANGGNGLGGAGSSTAARKLRSAWRGLCPRPCARAWSRPRPS